MSTNTITLDPIQTTQHVDTAKAELRYQRLWRWHFYAGLFVMPLLLILSITGTLYVFQPQIEAALYKDKLTIEAPPVGTARKNYDDLAKAALSALPAGSELLRVNVNDAATASTELIYKLPSGAKTSVYLNPYSGAILGTLDVDKRFMQQVRMLHRQLLLGDGGGIAMELAATWTLVMLATGIALWWPQKEHKKISAKGQLIPRKHLKGRLWWRDLHAVIGIWFAVGALFFVFSGMPWSGVWGSGFKALATQLSFGYPSDARQSGHIHSAKPNETTLAELPFSETPWATGVTAVPKSAHQPQPMTEMAGMDMQGMDMSEMEMTQTGMPGMHMNGADMPVAHPSQAPGATVRTPERISPEQAIAALKKVGMTSDYELALPKTPEGVFSVSYFPVDPTGQRTIHVDQYTGAIVSQTGYSQYGFIAKAISFGTALHMGRLFGLANQLICAIIALALGALSLTGLTMWWGRRPRGRLAAGAPPRTLAASTAKGWVIGLGVLGLVFPLMGLTLILVASFDEWLFMPKTKMPLQTGTQRLL